MFGNLTERQRAAWQVPPPFQTGSPVNDRPSLSRCQRWILESLASVASRQEEGTTVYELAAALNHNVRQTGVYLAELHRLHLVQYRTYAGGLLWWVNPTGLVLVIPNDSRSLDEEML